MRTNWLPLGVSIATVGLLTAFAVYQALCVNLAPDFFIYRAGAEMGLHGESPYDREKLRALVATQYPDNRLLIDHCGFFLPPQAVLIFAPFAAVPYPAAKVPWALLNGLCAAAVLLVLRLFASRPLPRGAQLLLPLVLSWNYLTAAIIELGQTSLLCTGCIAAGLWCFEHKREGGVGGTCGRFHPRNWPTLGVVLWSVAFVKPHVALSLIPLAWYLGGWKRAAALVAVVAMLNVIGATIVGGTPLFLRDYLNDLSSAHKAVMFNLASSNPEITSWNRLLFALTESWAGERFLIELTATTTVAGYLVWWALVVMRCWLVGKWPSPAWATTTAVVGSVWCVQALPYDLIWLALAVPWVWELFDNGYRFRGWLAAGLLVVQLLPLNLVGQLGISTHRPLGVALFALLVLVGPVGGRRVSLSA